MSHVGKSSSISSSAGSVVTSTNDVIEGMAATIFFFVVVIFFAILYLYTKHVWGPNRRSLLIFASYDHLSLPRCSLSSAFLEGLPITVFQSAVDPEEKLECAVCLSELRDGEQVRMLPKCSHGFHLECIDEWFQSQSTCPLCRSLVEMNPTPDSSAEEIRAPEAVQRDLSMFSSTQSPAAVLPANMLAAAEADLSMASSSVKRDRMLVIEIPRQAMENFSLPSTPETISERMKTPTSARRRSLARQLSQEKRTMVSSAACTGGSEDIELGLRGAAGESWRRILPRIPRNS